MLVLRGVLKYINLCISEFLKVLGELVKSLLKWYQSQARSQVIFHGKKIILQNIILHLCAHVVDLHLVP